MPVEECTAAIDTFAGWHLCLDVAERLLDGQPVEPIRGQDAMNQGWQELHDAYAERLGVGSTSS
jgi:hypothetical protein